MAHRGRRPPARPTCAVSAPAGPAVDAVLASWQLRSAAREPDGFAVTRTWRTAKRVVVVTEGAYVREIYEASYRRLVTQMYGIVGDQAEAEDAVQEAFARAVAAGGRFRHVDNPEAWLRTVAVNVLRRRWRRSRMFAVLSPRLATAPATGPEATEDHLVVLSALQSLPLAQREAVALFYLGDLSVAEIAATLGVPDGTVKSRLTRGRAALARLIGDLEVDNA